MKDLTEDQIKSIIAGLPDSKTYPFSHISVCFVRPLTIEKTYSQKKAHFLNELSDEVIFVRNSNDEWELR